MLNDQAGYLYEIPLLVIAAALLVALAAPIIPTPWNTVLIAILAAVVLLFLIYNFFVAGWLPRKRE